MTPEPIELPTPPMGGKVWLLERKGLFILEAGPGTLMTIACTHAGSGQLVIYDGIPESTGFFPAENMPEPPAYLPAEVDALMNGLADSIDGLAEKRLKWLDFSQRNGRAFARWNPIIMGSWMLNAGFNHGLTVEVTGEQPSVNALATIVWMPFRGKK